MPCIFVGRFGSISSGEARSASMEAKLERAKSRYGNPSLWLRAYRACSNGLVDESRK
jgi:hypothetical protein